MASISNDSAGRRRILFQDKNGDRKSFRLGKVSRRLAEEIKTKVESINTAAIAGCSLDGETAAWLGKIGAGLHAKLAGVGLVPPREASGKQARLGDFLESYIAGRSDVKPRTRINLNAARRRLVEFFGQDKALGEITKSPPGTLTPGLSGSKDATPTGRRAGRSTGPNSFSALGFAKKSSARTPLPTPRPTARLMRPASFSLPWTWPARCWTPAPMPNGGCCSLFPVSAGCVVHRNTWP